VLEKRKTEILSAVIHHHIKTAKPVGSDVLTREYGILLSSAAIRNLMAELEEDGYLTHPHTSAGRVPTDRGYRAYVNGLLELQDLNISEDEKLKKGYERRYNEIELLLSETSHILSILSKYTGFVMAPRFQYDEIKNIELISISNKELLIVLITRSGIIKHKKIEVSLSNKQLKKLRCFLNGKLKGISVAQANTIINAKIKCLKHDDDIDDVLRIAEKISCVFYNIRDDIYIDGISNITTASNFCDFEPIRSFMKFNKEKFVRMVNKDFNDNGINIKIGSENTLNELKNSSIVTTVYKSSNHTTIGILGIIGPKRMEYEKMISLVNHVSEMLNKFFEDKK
jgi:heat-inducible transcriptional repressor